MPAPRHRLVGLLLPTVMLAAAACAPAQLTAEPHTWNGSGPAASAPDGSVWVANEAAGSITVLDAATGEHVTTLEGIAAPHNVQATADGRSVLAVSGAGAVVRIDAEKLSVADHARTGRHPAHVVEDLHGNVYVTTAVDRRVTRYTPDLRRDIAVELVGAPHGVRLDRSGRVAVVANTGGGSLDVVDTRTGAITGRVRVGSSPVQVAITPDADRAYISVAGTREVVAVDLPSGTITGRLEMPAAPAQILLVDDVLLVANQGTPDRPGDTVSIIDIDEFIVLGSVRTGSGPHGLAADDTGRVWVTNAFDDTVTAVDVPSRTALYTVDVGASPNGITFSSTTPSVAPPLMPLLLPHAIAHPEDSTHSH
ncbi:MAG TPA: hypothetical protein VFQ19_02060 [Nocardioidaceae bacterium]|nr:hypothetical protein [Nocardioidaceae bacterium]